MDTNSIYESYREPNNNYRVVKQTFYTEKIKDKSVATPKIYKLKRLLTKLLPK